MPARTLQPQALAGLKALAAGLCDRTGLSLAIAETEQWSYNHDLHQILVPRNALAHGAAYAAGVVAHEVGHAQISRIHAFWDALTRDDPLLRHLALLMEERRVNAYMLARYPGAAQWMAAVAEVDRAAEALPSPDLPVFAWVAFHLIRSAWGLDDPHPDQPPAALALLDSTAAARAEHARLWPDPYAEVLAPGFAETVQPWLQRGWDADTLEERAVLRAALQALLLVRDRILPQVEALLGKEGAAALRKALERKDLIQALVRMRGRLPPGLLPRLCEALPAGAVQAALEGGRRPAPPTEDDLQTYQKARSAMQGQIEALEKAFAGLFRSRQRLHEIGGQPWGSRPEMRALMRWQADPARADPRIWRRPSIPARAEAAFLLLIDLSGSMREEKIEAAFKGAVVLVETLARLNLTTAVAGFQDRLIPFLDFGEALTDATRRRLGSMVLEVEGERPGGNNRYDFNDDGVALMSALQMLKAEPCHHRVLLVLCDGLPEARDGTVRAKDRLRQAIQAVTAEGDIHLVGLGLGPATPHVRNFYPDHDAQIPVEAFAERFAALMRRVLGEVGGGTGGAGILTRA